MAEAVKIAFGDTLTKILKTRRGIRDCEVYMWLRKMRPLNPHISNFNRIFAGQSVLIPDSYLEIVPDAQVWQNAFKGIPRSLEFPHNGHTQLFWTGEGVTIDSIAEGMFAGGRHRNLPLSAKRAVLIHNNPDLEQYLPANQVPANLLVDITPLRLSEFDIRYWQGERQLYLGYLQGMDPMTRDMFQDQGPEKATLIARIIHRLERIGASVGKDDVVKGIGYGVGGWSGLAASGEMAVSGLNALMHEMAVDAVEKFGPKLATSNKAHHLAKMAKFLKSHPNYPQVMRQTQEVPQLLLPMSRAKLVPPAANVDAAALARYFRKGHFQSFRRLASGRYMGPIAKQLNGRIGLFKALGRHATWYVPTIIGLYNVFDAAPEVRMHTLFEEGFGVLGGYAGTVFGVDLFAFSALVWCLVYLFTNFQLKKFIVSRYKEETNLSRTAFFRNHVPFVLYLPDFLSAGFFGTHLIMCVWGWRFFGKRKVFSDIDDPHVVIRHFSKKEIRRVKWVLMSGFILFAHGIAYYIFRSIWPEVFSR